MNITLTKILDLSTLVFPENKSWLAKFYASWVPILSTRLRGGTFLKDPAYRRLSIHARREDSKSEALNPRCVCQQGQTGDQQVVLRVPLSQQLSHNSAANNRKFEAQIDPLHYPRYKHPDRYWRGTQFNQFCSNSSEWIYNLFLRHQPPQSAPSIPWRPKRPSMHGSTKHGPLSGPSLPTQSTWTSPGQHTPRTKLEAFQTPKTAPDKLWPPNRVNPLKSNPWLTSCAHMHQSWMSSIFAQRQQVCSGSTPSSVTTMAAAELVVKCFRKCLY